MVKIKPFKAIFYNQKKISDLSKVICPPYDVITQDERKRYYRLHPFNIINLILSKKKGKVDKYTNAKNIFLDWLNRGILEKDKTECFYLYEQKYLPPPFSLETVSGKQKDYGLFKKRVGFFGLFHLSDERIFTHERTKEETKKDRFLLLKATEANLCPIFVLFSDKKKILNSIYQKISKRNPLFDIQDEDKVYHRLWRIDEKNLIEELRESFKDKSLFIADGHHRYETACSYRDLKRKEIKNFTGKEDFNYILAYFTDSESKGLTILGFHRAIKKNSNILKVLENYFKIKEKSRTELFSSMERLSKKAHIFGMYKDKKFFSLYLKNQNLLDKIKLDVQILNFIFSQSNIEEKDIIYSQDINWIIEAVNKREAKLGFFLNPLKIEQILEISLKKEKLPQKSSYFYPKVPSGLLINKFNVYLCKKEY